MLLKIPRLYDSHTHFLATGELASGLQLQPLTNADQILNWDLQNPSYYRADWLVGFGWQDHAWTVKPTLQILDQLSSTFPIYLAKADGHAAWVNSAALKVLGIKSDSGLIFEADHLQAWDRLPLFTESQRRQHILKACQVYNQAGFTHVRDMTGTESLWNSLTSLESENLLSVAIEENFTFYNLEGFEKALSLADYARKHETALVKAKGVKFFYDGSLGSQTAYLSKPYLGIEGGTCGTPLWKLSDIETIFLKTWKLGLEVSVHTIGDQAAHDIVSLARKISAKGAVGRLNLEHVQVLRPETIQMMKPLHVRCHLQPCHWLSDKKWLQQKLADLYRYAFPWESLRAAQVPLSFGCDSPVEKPSVLANLKALKESPKAKIKKFAGDFADYHSHPDSKFASDSYTIIEDEKIIEVVFQGQRIL